MKLTRLAALPLAALGLVAGCASAGHPAASGGHTTTPASAPATTPPPPAPTPSPDGKATMNCSYNLSPSVYGNNYLTGEVDITNTGNVGTIDRIKIAWPQQGFAPIVAVKTVHSPYGSTKAVEFHVNAGNVSNSNVITNLQNWEQGHNFPGNDCTFKVKIVSTYGPAH